MSFDATSDRGFTQLNKLAGLYGPWPDYVKAASPQEALTPDEMHDTAYADPLHRQFPCHTKAACYLSTLYFLSSHHEQVPASAERVARRLEKMAEDHGILPDVAELVQRYLDYGKAAQADPSDDSCYALVSQSSVGKERRYPLRNAREVKAAAEWFAQYRDHFRFAERKRIAERILDKASEYGACLGEYVGYTLEKQAGRGVCDLRDAATQLRYRAKLSRVDPKVSAVLEKLAADLERNPLLVEDPTTMAELASTMDTFDREHYLAGKYSATFKRPEDVLFSGSVKYAQEFIDGTCPTLTGAIYDKQQLSKLSLLQIGELMGADIADSVRDGLCVDTDKLAEVVSTLPLPDAIHLDSIMSDLGELPVHTKAAALKLSDQERAKLAGEYLVNQAAG